MNLNPKTPFETRLYEVDFSHELALGQDFIESAVLVSTDGTVVVDSIAWSASSVFLTLSGGTNAENSSFDLTITTAGAQTITRDIDLYVSNSGDSPYSTGTKGQLVTMAYDELTLAGYAFDVTPEEQAVALGRLDALMGEWRISSMDLGYNQPTTVGGGALSDVSGIPDFATNTVALSLALRIAPTLGKTLSGESRMALASAKTAIRAYCARTPTMRLPSGVPIGAGQRYGLSPFTQGPRSDAQQVAISGGQQSANISDMVAIFVDHENG